MTDNARMDKIKSESRAAAYGKLAFYREMMGKPMPTDNARIVREALESARPLLEHGFQEIHADIYSPALQQLYDSFAALTALETELTTSQAREAGLTKALAEVQADLERAREEKEELLLDVAELHPMNDCAQEIHDLRESLLKIAEYAKGSDDFLFKLVRAALAPEQKGTV